MGQERNHQTYLSSKIILLNSNLVKFPIVSFLYSVTEATATVRRNWDRKEYVNHSRIVEQQTKLGIIVSKLINNNIHLIYNATVKAQFNSIPFLS